MIPENIFHEKNQLLLSVSCCRCLVFYIPARKTVQKMAPQLQTGEILGTWQGVSNGTVNGQLNWNMVITANNSAPRSDSHG